MAGIANIGPLNRDCGASHTSSQPHRVGWFDGCVATGTGAGPTSARLEGSSATTRQRPSASPPSPTSTTSCSMEAAATRSPSRKAPSLRQQVLVGDDVRAGLQPRPQPPQPVRDPGPDPQRQAGSRRLDDLLSSGDLAWARKGGKLASNPGPGGSACCCASTCQNSQSLTEAGSRQLSGGSLAEPPRPFIVGLREGTRPGNRLPRRRRHPRDRGP